MATTLLKRDIAPGERLELQGDTEIRGNIGAGACITVKDGSLLIEGDVADKTEIEVKSSKKTSFNNVSISGNGVVVINGQVITSNSQINNSSDVTINGLTGSHVSIKSSGAIKLLNDANAGLSLYAGSSISIKSTGAELNADAGASFSAHHIGGGSVDAGSSVNIVSAGNYSRIDAGSSVNISHAGASCRIDAGSSANIGSLGPKSRLDTGSSANVNVAHESAKISAGSRKTVGRISSQMNDFPAVTAEIDATPVMPAEKKPEAAQTPPPANNPPPQNPPNRFRL